MMRLREWWRERQKAKRREASALNMMMAMVQMLNPDAPEPPYIRTRGAWVPPWRKPPDRR